MITDPEVPIDEYVRIEKPERHPRFDNYFLAGLVGETGCINHIYLDGNYYVDIQMSDDKKFSWGDNVLHMISLAWIQPLDRTFLRTGEKAQWIFGIYRRHNPLTASNFAPWERSLFDEDETFKTAEDYPPFWYVNLCGMSRLQPSKES